MHFFNVCFGGWAEAAAWPRRMELNVTPILHQLVWDDMPEDLQAYLEDHREDLAELIDKPFRGITALGLACQLGRIECARVLLETGGASCYERSELGFFPPQDANGYGSRELMKVLFRSRQEQLHKQWRVREAALHQALCLVRTN